MLFGVTLVTKDAFDMELLAFSSFTRLP